MSHRATDPPAPARRSSRRGRRRRWLRRGLLALVILFIVGELTARYGLGLGQPPLLQEDSEIEYMFQPSQTCHRFHHLIHYNAYSQRSDDFPAHKTDPHELRVMVVGDSVINGGALTDQADICTSILQRKLSADLHRPVIVMNVSAGSWGPPNELAYVKRFGFFDADVVVLELSSHDYADAPTFEKLVGVDPAFPDHRPLLALQEAWTRYLLPRLRGKPNAEAPIPGMAPGYPTSVSHKDIDWCLASEKEFYERVRAAGAYPLLLQHLTKPELGGHLDVGHDLNYDVGHNAGVAVIDDGNALKTSRDAGISAHRDDIHPNEVGQRIIADLLSGPIEAWVQQQGKSPATAPANLPGR